MTKLRPFSDVTGTPLLLGPLLFSSAIDELGVCSGLLKNQNILHDEYICCWKTKMTLSGPSRTGGRAAIGSCTELLELN